MSRPTDRVALFNRDMEPLPELTANEMFSRVRSEELNGEHSLTIETTRHLQEGWRALTRDATGKWREWVVTEIDEEHASGEHAIGTYHLVWSLQYDLTLSYYHDMDEAVSIGIGNRCTALEAAQHVLTGVANWTVGTCDAPDIVPGEPVYAPDGLTPKDSNKINTRGRVKGHPDQAGCIFIRESAWSKLSKLVKCAFYEVDAEIEVSAVGNVTARRLCLRDHLGNVEALRRFDWSEDLTGIKRKPDPGPYYCRVVPLGKTQEEYADDDVTKFNWPMDITEETGTEENPGPYWIQDDEAAAVFRIKQPDGSYVYPTVAVEYNDEDDPELLLNAAQLDLHNHTRPGVTYEASVLQLSEAGMDVHSVALGDEVQAVDYGFNEDVGLRIEGRVTKIEVDELAPESTMEITIGQLRDNMTDFLHSMNTEMDTAFEQLLSQHSELAETLMQMNTAKYVDELLDRLNTEINGTGGYTYIIPGEGIITYDKEVSDPLVGSEAGRVVQLKGGYLRIASSRKTPFAGIDDWEFNTLLDAGHIVSDLVTTVKIVAGYIGDVDSDNYWDLDSGKVMVTGDMTLKKTAPWRTNGSGNQYTTETKIGSYVPSSLAIMRRLMAWSYSVSDSIDVNILGLKISSGDTIYIFPSNVSTYNQTSIGGHSTIATDGALAIIAGANQQKVPSISLWKLGAGIHFGDGNPMTSNNNGFFCDETGVSVYATTSSGVSIGTSSGSGASNISLYGATVSIGSGSSSATTVNGTLNVERKATVASLDVNSFYSSNVKSRVVLTDNYDKRALYCYETATPTFGDIGSSIIGDDGLCYIHIDDMFSEAARTDFAYQVFLQKCGEGDLWVKEKSQLYFVVEGTPNLHFDWEVKARQKNTGELRLENYAIADAENMAIADGVGDANKTEIDYESDLSDVRTLSYEIEDQYESYVSDMEHLYDDDYAA